MNINITRPQKEDVEELNRLFAAGILDAFHQDGIDDNDGIRVEVEKQLSLLQQDLESQGSEVYFLLARTEAEIVGTIAYGEPNNLIRDNLAIDWQGIPEITSVYVLPAFQGQGVGTLLFNSILCCLQYKNVAKFCLDGGYKKSQRFWIKRLGDPTVTLKDYWGKGLDHLIWLRNLQDVGIGI